MRGWRAAGLEVGPGLTWEGVVGFGNERHVGFVRGSACASICMSQHTPGSQIENAVLIPRAPRVYYSACVRATSGILN